MPRRAIEGLTLQGQVTQLSNYNRKRDNAPMLGLGVLVSGDLYRTVHEVSIEAAGVVLPKVGDVVSMNVAVGVTREGEQYITAYPGTLETVAEMPANVRKVG